MVTEDIRKIREMRASLRAVTSHRSADFICGAARSDEPKPTTAAGKEQPNSFMTDINYLIE